jgi:hypothetical protein
VVGKLKNEVEKEILRRARLEGRGIYDLDYAFRTARELLGAKREEVKLAPMVLSY